MVKLNQASAASEDVQVCRFMVCEFRLGKNNWEICAIVPRELAYRERMEIEFPIAH